MYIFSTYDAYVVETSSRSKKVGYIRMSNDRIHFESLMIYIFPILYLLFLYLFGRSRVWMEVWFFFSDTNSMFMIFLYIFRGIGIISVLDLIMLHNSLHFLENLFDLWFEIQTDGWKKPGPLLLLSAVPDACSILQCKYSNMVKYNRPNDDDGTENCISYSKIVVNKYKY